MISTIAPKTSVCYFMTHFSALDPFFCYAGLEEDNSLPRKACVLFLLYLISHKGMKQLPLMNELRVFGQ